ncbi:MAG TPA: PIN domain-containing protein [Syntrophales bacterium]|nr:PIN domain-containing protein [Syntrophales bacterium]HPN09855.1 PIN domain-containing protein [Syntrophales bacterium]HPX80807.1 PIN domain-containing protein [Syntrophales bacterium]HQB14384.1 PIN domain-containing protein [Syntrophales bacterium]HQK80121.1 PIN domain-containing protein [Syntrophales bacterium]
MKLFLDANIIFTAAYSAEGISRGLFRLATAGKCLLCTSAFAHEEAARNIQKKAPDKLPELTRLMPQVAILPEPHPRRVAWAAGLPLARKDAPILAAAIQGKVDILVTGDRRDFGCLFGQVLEGVTISTPAEAVEAIICKLHTF